MLTFSLAAGRPLWECPTAADGRSQENKHREYGRFLLQAWRVYARWRALFGWVKGFLRKGSLQGRVKYIERDKVAEERVSDSGSNDVFVCTRRGKGEDYIHIIV